MLRKIFKKNPLTIPSKIPGIHLTKVVKYLYNEKYKTKEIE
jgi:hypothetical protein